MKSSVVMRCDDVQHWALKDAEWILSSYVAMLKRPRKPRYLTSILLLYYQTIIIVHAYYHSRLMLYALPHTSLMSVLANYLLMYYFLPDCLLIYLCIRLCIYISIIQCMIGWMSMRMLVWCMMKSSVVMRCDDVQHWALKDAEWILSSYVAMLKRPRKPRYLTSTLLLCYQTIIIESCTIFASYFID